MLLIKCATNRSSTLAQTFGIYTTAFMPVTEKFLQFDWPRAEVFQATFENVTSVPKIMKQSRHGKQMTLPD